MSETELVRRWQALIAEIADIAQDAQRDPAQVQLIAVSKQYPAQDILTLARAGQADFGENYVQEALGKQQELLNTPINWHFIGRLQSNKAKYLAGSFALIHSLDRLKVASALHERCKKINKQQAVLIQVNMAAEKQKAGIMPTDLAGFAQSLQELDSLQLQGLMYMPPFAQDSEQTRLQFAGLERLRQELQQKLGRHLPHLSMGMSQDYALAIQQGATLIRIGTRIFGARD